MFRYCIQGVLCSIRPIKMAVGNDILNNILVTYGKNTNFTVKSGKLEIKKL